MNFQTSITISRRKWIYIYSKCFLTKGETVGLHKRQRAKAGNLYWVCHKNWDISWMQCLIKNVIVSHQGLKSYQGFKFKYSSGSTNPLKIIDIWVYLFLKVHRQIPSQINEQTPSHSNIPSVGFQREAEFLAALQEQLIWCDSAPYSAVMWPSEMGIMCFSFTSVATRGFKSSGSISVEGYSSRKT